jgi:hypothetical protein
MTRQTVTVLPILMTKFLLLCGGLADSGVPQRAGAVNTPLGKTEILFADELPPCEREEAGVYSCLKS